MARRSKDEPISQRTHRKFIRTRDQHGRVWECVIERETLHPVGPMQLVIGEGNPRVVAQPPILPPQNPNVLQFRDDEVGAFKIAYDEWLAQHDSEIQRWHDQLLQYAMSQYGEDFERYIARPSPTLLRLVGPAPFPRQQIIAAREAHPWALGYTAAKPSWATQVFPAPVRTQDEKHDDETAFLRADGWDPAEEQREEMEAERRRSARLEAAMRLDRDEDPLEGEDDEGEDEPAADDGESEGGFGPDGTWPRHHAQTWWLLSDGNKVQGRAAARSAQRELDRASQDSFAGAG